MNPNNNILIDSKDDIVQLLMNLIAIDSTTGKEWLLGTLLKDFLERSLGCNVTIHPLPNDSSRFNILATFGTPPFFPPIFPGPRILFNTHLDTVPPFIPPTKDDKNIYGRGANDAKGQIASQIFAIRQLIREMPDIASQLGMLFVVGEEVDHIGMIEANKLGIKPEYLIIGEPLDMKFASIQKGAVKLKLISHGIAAHSGTPERGESAIHKLLNVLEDIRRHPWPTDPHFGDTTLNIGFIEGGQALNALASSASASIFFRVTESSKDLFEIVKTIVAGRVEIEILGTIVEPVKATKPPPPYETQPIAGISDVAYFDYRNHSKGVYIFGPGSITSAHSEHEFVEITDLKNSVSVLVNIVKQILKE